MKYALMIVLLIPSFGFAKRTKQAMHKGAHVEIAQCPQWRGADYLGQLLDAVEQSTDCADAMALAAACTHSRFTSKEDKKIFLQAVATACLREFGSAE